jgi:hypothetical protein
MVFQEAQRFDYKSGSSIIIKFIDTESTEYTLCRRNYLCPLLKRVLFLVLPPLLEQGFLSNSLVITGLNGGRWG